MGSLLDTILGSFGMGESAPPVSPEMMDSSGGYPPDPRDMSIQGFPASGVPMPRPRPPEAGPGIVSAPAGMSVDDTTMPSGPMNILPPAAPAPQRGGLLAAALGVDPDKMKTIAASLGAGLAGVKNTPFIGEAIANGAGKAIEGGNKQDELTYKDKLAALDRALKLQQIKQLGSYRDDLTDAKFANVGIAQQNADTRATGVNNNFVLGKDRNGIRQQDADTRSDVAPSTIRKNEASAGLSDARTKVATGEIDLTEPASKRAARADQASDRFYKPRLNQLVEEKKRIQAMPGTPQQRQEAAAAIDQKLQQLDADYFKLKEDNRRVHGIGPNGEDLAPKKGSAAGRVADGFQDAGAAPKPGKVLGMGTRDDPHQPQTQADYDSIPVGQIFRDPGDGSLKIKD